jgi:hypothetical protein
MHWEQRRECLKSSSWYFLTFWIKNEWTSYPSCFSHFCSGFRQGGGSSTNSSLICATFFIDFEIETLFEWMFEYSSMFSSFKLLLQSIFSVRLNYNSLSLFEDSVLSIFSLLYLNIYLFFSSLLRIYFCFSMFYISFKFFWASTSWIKA